MTQTWSSTYQIYGNYRRNSTKWKTRCRDGNENFVMILTAAFKTILTLTHTSESTATHWHWHLQVSTTSNIFAKFQVDVMKFKICRYTTTDWCPFLKKCGEHKEVEKHTYRVIAVLSLKPSQNVSRVCRHTSFRIST